MRGPFAVLLWEQWRRTRWVVLIQPLWLLFALTIGDIEDKLRGIVIVCGISGFFLLFLLVGNVEARETENVFHEPSRLYRLPGSTTRLAMRLFLSRVTMLALFVLLMGADVLVVRLMSYQPFPRGTGEIAVVVAVI